MHPLKVVEIKNPFGIFQPTTQIPREWVGFIFFLKNMFWWDTLLLTPIFTHKILLPTLSLIDVSFCPFSKVFDCDDLIQGALPGSDLL